MDLTSKKQIVYNKYKLDTLDKKFQLFENKAEKNINQRLFLIIFTVFLFSIINLFINFPNFKDESLYIFAGQVTFIALIFPIILSIVSIFNNNKFNFDDLFSIYSQSSYLKTVYKTSLLTTFLYAISFLFSYDFIYSSNIRKSINLTLIIVFISNILLTYKFLKNTINFLTIQNRFNFMIISFLNNKKENTLKIINIICSQINESTTKNDHIAFDRNYENLIEFLDIYIIFSTKIENNSPLNTFNKEAGFFEASEFDKILLSIQECINETILLNNYKLFNKLFSIYFRIYSRNYDIIDNITLFKLMEYHTDSIKLVKKINNNESKLYYRKAISTWYQWIKPLFSLPEKTTFEICKKHLFLTTLTVNYYSQIEDFQGLDFFTDCLSRWESEVEYMPNFITPESHLKTVYDTETNETLANLAIEYKIIAFYLIQKHPFDKLILSKYYKVLIKGTTLFKTIDMRTPTYSFNNLDDIIFCYLRLLTNTKYEYFFNDLLENSDRVIEITGLIHGGIIPELESRILKLIIQLLLLDSSKYQTSSYKWKEAFSHSSVAKIDKTINLIHKLNMQIQNFRDYNSLNWNEKKLVIAKNKILIYIKKLLEIAKKTYDHKFTSIQLDETKMNEQILENTFYLKDLESCLNESSFSILISNKIINYKDEIERLKISEYLPSKYLTADYDITIDNLFKPSYYTSLIDSSIYQALNQDKRTEYYYEDDISKLLLKILLRSYIFASPIVFFNHSEILTFMLRNAYRITNFPYKIESKESNQYFKVGKTIFKFVYNLPIKCTAYIMGSHTIKNIHLEKVTPETLSKVSVDLNPNDTTEVEIHVSFPIEVTLTENAQILEIIMPK